MSSREIAELTGSTHDNVLKTVRSLIARSVVSGNETPYVHPQNGQTYKEFRLDYRNTMVVVSGYSVELRARIIDRWQELEQSVQGDPFSAMIPRDYPSALRALPWLGEVTIAPRSEMQKSEPHQCAYIRARCVRKRVCDVRFC